MKLKGILGGCAVALGLLTYSDIDNSYANDMNKASTLAALSQVVYSERPVLTKKVYEKRKRSLKYLRNVFVEADKKDPRPSANIEDLAVEVIGKPLIRKHPYGGHRYGYGLMTPAESYVILPRHGFRPIDLYIREALEGDKFPTDNNLSKRIAVYNLDKSNEAAFNFLRRNINVRDGKGNLYPLNPSIYCSVPSLDIVVTKVDSPKNASPLKISVREVKVGDRLEFFNLGNKGSSHISQATGKVIGHSRKESKSLVYSGKYSEKIPNVFWANILGRKGIRLSGSIFRSEDNKNLFGMVIGHAFSMKDLKIPNHLVATSAGNIVKAVKWCAKKGLKELDSSTIVN